MYFVVNTKICCTAISWPSMVTVMWDKIGMMIIRLGVCIYNVKLFDVIFFGWSQLITVWQWKKENKEEIEYLSIPRCSVRFDFTLKLILGSHKNELQLQCAVIIWRDIIASYSQISWKFLYVLKFVMLIINIKKLLARWEQNSRRIKIPKFLRITGGTGLVDVFF